MSYKLPARLRPGDTIRFVSPASAPTREGVEKGAATLRALGLNVQIAPHVVDELGYLAGKDEDRLADLPRPLAKRLQNRL